jgi:non-ribosomal peptide synthase protein (TIGR01720 family)
MTGLLLMDAIGGADVTTISAQDVEKWPLGPAQTWFFQQDPADPHRFNQAAALRIKIPVLPAAVMRAVRAVTEAHEAFSLRFTRDDTNVWRQHRALAADVPIEHLSLGDAYAGDAEAALSARVDRLHRRLDVTQGPVAAAVLVDYGVRGDPVLVLVAHHLVVDTVSWRVLAEDLSEAIQADPGEPLTVPDPGLDVTRWYDAQRRAAALWQDEIATWRARIPADAGLGPDADSGTATRHHVLRLGKERTAALSGEHEGGRHGPDHVILAVLARTLRRAGDNGVLVDIETHGRTETVPGVDPSRTVGWLTATWPLYVQPGEEPIAREAVRLAEQMREAPRAGQGFGVLRDCLDVPALRALPRPRVLFTYLGRYAGADQPVLEIVPAALGDGRSELRSPHHVLTVNAWVDGGELTVEWLDNGRESLDRAASAFGRALESAADDLTRRAPEPVAEAAPPPAPVTDTEAVVKAAWAEVLPQPESRIGVADDFFELGGDSIHMIRIASRLRRTLGVRVPLNVIFDYTTIRDLAAAIDGVRAGSLTF